MAQDMNTDIERRKLVKLAAGAAVVMPLGGLVACSGEDSEKAAEAAKSTMDDAAEAAKDAVDATTEAAADVADAAGEVAGDAVDAAKEAAGDAMDAAGEMAADAKDAATGAMSDAKDAAGEAMQDANDAVSGTAGGLPKVTEDDPIAVALGYKHDASKIDAAKYPGRGAAANEMCSNCALYVAGDNGWGACSIFAGKAVNGSGWCNSYNRKQA